MGRADGRDEGEKREHKKVVFRLPLGAEKLVLIRHGHHGPSALGGTGRRIQDLPSVHDGAQVAAVQRQYFGEPLRAEVAVDELLSGVVDNVPLAVQDEDVARRAQLDVPAEVRNDLIVQVHLDDADAPAVRYRRHAAR